MVILIYRPSHSLRECKTNCMDYETYYILSQSAS